MTRVSASMMLVFGVASEAILLLQAGHKNVTLPSFLCYNHPLEFFWNEGLARSV